MAFKRQYSFLYKGSDFQAVDIVVKNGMSPAGIRPGDRHFGRDSLEERAGATKHSRVASRFERRIQTVNRPKCFRGGESKKSKN